jgi:hypothetical protein
MTPQARPAELSLAFRQDQRSPAVLAFVKHIKAMAKKTRV